MTICSVQDCDRKVQCKDYCKSKYPQLSLLVNNGISLCVPCHKEVHGHKVVI